MRTCQALNHIVCPFGTSNHAAETKTLKIGIGSLYSKITKCPSPSIAPRGHPPLHSSSDPPPLADLFPSRRPSFPSAAASPPGAPARRRAPPPGPPRSTPSHSSPIASASMQRHGHPWPPPLPQLIRRRGNGGSGNEFGI